MKARVWFLMVMMLAVRVNADVAEPPVESGSQAAVEKPAEEAGSSMAPIVGYEPTFGFIAGAAYFYQSEKTDWGIDISTNFHKVYQAHGHVAQDLGSSWQYEIQLGGNQGYDPYYGEGGETKVGDRVKLWGVSSRNEVRLAFKVSKNVSFGIVGDLRVHTENGTEDSPARMFPNETSLGIGGEVIIDYRNHPNRPTKGFLLRTRGTVIPPKWSTVPNSKEFAQLESSFTVYQAILDDIIPDVVAAFRVMGGYTFGHSTYGYAYRLGGSDRLNGYLENRFRGDKYYLQQTELRFPIFKMVSGAALLGFGDATHSVFSNPKMSYGVGLRVGLPPDWVSKVRIDLAFGKDEKGVFVDYGQTF